MGKRPHTGDRYETTKSSLEELVLLGTRAPWVCEEQDEGRFWLSLSETAQMGKRRTLSRSLRGQGSQEKRFRRQDTQKGKDKTLQKEDHGVLKTPPALDSK